MPVTVSSLRCKRSRQVRQGHEEAAREPKPTLSCSIVILRSYERSENVSGEETCNLTLDMMDGDHGPDVTRCRTCDRAELVKWRLSEPQSTNPCSDQLPSSFSLPTHIQHSSASEAVFSFKMAPPKTSGGPVQARLSFPTTKGGVSAAAKGKKSVISTVAPSTAVSTTKAQSTVSKDTAVASKGPAKAPQKQPKRPADSDEEDDDALDFRADKESEEEIEEPVEAVIAPPPVAAPEIEEISSASDDEGMETAKGKAKAKGLKDLMNDRQFKEGYKIAKAKVGGDLTSQSLLLLGQPCGAQLTLIYPSESAAKESKALTILRTWDLSYEYGPCVGMTRMERWQRASKLGLDPPEIVRSW